jgi:hypothetical protein
MAKSHASTNVAQWLLYAERLLLVFREFQNVRIPRTDAGVSDVHLLGYSLLARTSSNFSGVVTLVRAALPVEARTLARCCIENMFYQVNLLKEGKDFVRQMAEADVLSRDMRAQSILERPEDRDLDEIFDADERKNIQSFLKELRKEWPKRRSIEPKKLASKGPVARAYLIYSQLSADSAHPSITSLERYVDHKDAIATLKFVEPPTNKELVDAMIWACIGAIGVFVAGSEMLEAVELNEKIDKMAQEYNRLANPTGKL